MIKWKGIVIHHSLTKDTESLSWDAIKRYHIDTNGWSDIGYHFYIDISGKIWKGRDIDKTGAHTKGHNRNSIGICYCGGVENDGKTPKDTRTPEQKESLLHVLKTLMAMFPLATIYSHNEFANKACPSFDATKEYENL